MYVYLMYVYFKSNEWVCVYTNTYIKMNEKNVGNKERLRGKFTK